MIMRALDRHSRSGAQDGFTLIELLVGLALLALTVALMPGTLRLGSRAWETRSDLERLSELASGLAILEQRIAEASPAFERSATGSIRVSFTGDSHTLDFVSPTEIGPAGAGVYRYRLEPHMHARADGAAEDWCCGCRSTARVPWRRLRQARTRLGCSFRSTHRFDFAISDRSRPTSRRNGTTSGNGRMRCPACWR